TSINGYAELTIEDEDGNLSEAQREYLDIVVRNSERLMSLINDLLFTARVSDGKFKLELADTDITDIATYSVVLAQPFAESAGIKLTGEAEPGLHLYGDGQRLSQALDNLISNAIKFTP